MDKKLKFKTISNIILFSISIGILIYFCIDNNNLSTLIKIIPSLNLIWIFTALMAMFLSWVIDSLVLNILISNLESKKFSKVLSFKLTMVGQFFSSITPLGVGGQPMQAVFLSKHGISTGVGVSILVRKFIIYQSSITIYSLLFIILKSGMFINKIPGFIILSMIGFLSQCFVVVLLVLFYINKKFTIKIISSISGLLFKTKLIKKPDEIKKRIEKQINLFIENNSSMKKNMKTTLFLFFLTLIQISLLFSVPFFTFKAFHNQGFPIIDMIATQTFVNMISSYTPLPGASGTSEGSFVVLFNDFFGSEFLFPAMILCRLITYYTNIIFGIGAVKIVSK